MLDQAHAKRAAAAAPSNPSRSTQHAVLCALMAAASSHLSPVKAPARSNQGKGHSQYATLGVWQRSWPAAAGPPMAPCLAGCAQQQETGMAAVTSVTRRLRRLHGGYVVTWPLRRLHGRYVGYTAVLCAYPALDLACCLCGFRPLRLDRSLSLPCWVADAPLHTAAASAAPAS